jgi:competence protein ComFC
MLKELWFDFLFPKEREILVLESISTEKLLEILPSANSPEESEVIALFDYSHHVVKEIIWEIKYSGNKTLAEKLGQILFDAIMEELYDKNILEKWPTVLLIPMPISGKRRFERGWNQAELLAKAVKAHDKAQVMKYMPGQLVKVRHTESQTRTASKSERKENLKDSMKIINPPSVDGRFVILIDDVTTTGSTFAEARRALKNAGAKKVLCFAVAH